MKVKKKQTCFLKTSTLEFQRKIVFGLKHFDFQEQFMIGTSLIELTQFEKTEVLGNVLFRWEISKLYSTFATSFFTPFPLL